MAKKPNLGQINSPVFSVGQLNDAFTKIDNAFENTLSLDGSTPNAMNADLDMNGNDIINVGTLSGTSIDVEEATIGGKLFTGTITWRSDWLTATSYQNLDVVRYNGNLYICLEEHTSGVFATDLSSSKWEIFVEATGGGGGGGVTDHGDLTGLADDDHTQYHNDARGDARYYTQAQTDALIDVGSLRISDSFVGNNTRGLLSGLKITSGRWNGAWRHRDIGDIIWYFAFSAMTLAPDMFTQAERQACVATALDKAVVGPRQNSSAYTQYTMVQFPSGKIFFCNIAGTSAGSAPSDAAITTAGSFLGDGTITWEYTGLQAPTTWEWHILDVDTGLASVKFPDSHDAYVGMLAAAAEAAAVDAAWLATASAHPGFTRIQLIDQLITSNMTDQLNGTSPGPRLTYTFQDGVDETGAAYTTRFLADNVEVWRGYRAQVYLRGVAGLSTTAAATNAADVKSGCLGSDLFASGRFKAYVGRPNWDTITGNSVFVTDFRFHIWPAMHGMLSTVAEWQDYGDDVIVYTKANTPGLWNASLDTLAIAEWFWAADRFFHLTEARETLLWRVTSRNIANVTITDAALAATDNESGVTTSTIVGITGTKAEFNTAVTDGNFMYVGDAPTSHTHTASEVTDFSEAVDDRVSSLLVAGTNITLTYNDGANTLTIDAAGGGGFDYGKWAAMTGLTPY